MQIPRFAVSTENKVQPALFINCFKWIDFRELTAINKIKWGEGGEGGWGGEGEGGKLPQYNDHTLKKELEKTDQGNKSKRIHNHFIMDLTRSK